MRTRSIQVIFRLDQQENAHLQQQAAAAGLSVAAFLRSLVMGMELIPRPPAEWREVVRQLAAIGNNINQIARVANRSGAVNAAMVQQIQEAQAQIWRHVKGL